MGFYREGDIHRKRNRRHSPYRRRMGHRHRARHIYDRRICDMAQVKKARSGAGHSGRNRRSGRKDTDEISQAPRREAPVLYQPEKRLLDAKEMADGIVTELIDLGKRVRNTLEDKKFEMEGGFIRDWMGYLQIRRP